MFTLEQTREFVQKIDDLVNNNLDKPIMNKLLIKLEDEFSKIFQKDELTHTRQTYFTFRISETYFALSFELLGSSNLRMFCVNKFEDITDGGGIKRTKWGERTPAHQFIYKNCNPEGVLILEKILFEEVV